MLHRSKLALDTRNISQRHKAFTFFITSLIENAVIVDFHQNDSELSKIDQRYWGSREIPRSMKNEDEVRMHELFIRNFLWRNFLTTWTSLTHSLRFFKEAVKSSSIFLESSYWYRSMSTNNEYCFDEI